VLFQTLVHENGKKTFNTLLKQNLGFNWRQMNVCLRKDLSITLSGICPGKKKKRNSTALPPLYSSLLSLEFNSSFLFSIHVFSNQLESLNEMAALQGLQSCQSGAMHCTPQNQKKGPISTSSHPLPHPSCSSRCLDVFSCPHIAEQSLLFHHPPPHADEQVSACWHIQLDVCLPL